MILSREDIESIKKSNSINPTQVKNFEKTIKWLECPKYDMCLKNAALCDWVNWSCVNCGCAKEAQVKDLVIFRAKKDGLPVESKKNLIKSFQILIK